MPIEQLRSLQRHERILEAAERVFARRGYHHTAVDDIAAEADTSKGGIYFHFPTKQAIFLALLDRLAALLRTRVEAAVPTQDQPIGRAEAALRVVLDTFADHPPDAAARHRGVPWPWQLTSRRASAISRVCWPRAPSVRADCAARSWSV